MTTPDFDTQQVKILNWKPMDHGALKGVFDIELASGMILRQLSFFEQGGRHWTSVPQQRFEVGGTVKYRPVVSFANRAAGVEFYDSVLRAIRDEHPEVLE